jgi:hypothetical protein
MHPPRPARRLIDHLRRAAWLGHDRVVAWGCVLLVETAALVLFLALWLHSVVMHLDHPTSSDFVSFYAAGKLTLAGTPAGAYDHAAHLLAEGQATQLGATYQYFFYPPVYLLLCAPLALLHYYVAYAAFEVLTQALFAMVMRAVLRQRGVGWLAPLLAFAAVWWTIGGGWRCWSHWSGAAPRPCRKAPRYCWSRRCGGPTGADLRPDGGSAGDRLAGAAGARDRLPGVGEAGAAHCLSGVTADRDRGNHAAPAVWSAGWHHCAGAMCSPRMAVGDLGRRRKVALKPYAVSGA